MHISFILYKFYKYTEILNMKNEKSNCLLLKLNENFKKLEYYIKV